MALVTLILPQSPSYNEPFTPIVLTQPEKTWEEIIAPQVKQVQDEAAAKEATRIAEEKAAAEKAAEAARIAALPKPVTYTAYAYKAPTAAYGGLTGSIGYSLYGGNCVHEPGVNNPGYGNPINWPATSYQPWIGATVLFTWNHTAVVAGLWSNGDIEVRQRNAGGMSHRVPRNMIRGYR